MDRLFEKWEKAFEFEAFIRDGAVNEENYERPHVLFVLRDMNCRMKRDLRQDIMKDGGGWKTWNNAARWTAALLDGEKSYPRKMTAEKRSCLMARTAVMNLKKEGGFSRADGRKTEAAVKQQKEFILQELEMLTPDIIVCCGLSSGGAKGNAVLLKEHVLENTQEWQKFRSVELERYWWYFYAVLGGRRIPVISFCHPQTTVLEGVRGHEDLFEPLYRDMLHIRELFLEKT